jgi:phage/plasmid-like protein (TIGR03299 family)
MWQFIDEFQRQSGIVLETAGSLRNGKTTWVLAKKGSIEAVNGDVVEEYFLFRNSFDGSTPISVTFTNIRVVCNNTLTMALRGARNIFNVRHTSSAAEQIKMVQKALGLKYIYQQQVNEVIDALVKTALTESRQVEILNTVIFPEQTKIVQTVDDNGQPVHSLEEAGDNAKTMRKNRINAVLELVETGAGTDIPGVKGTMWGLYNALTEWTDHSKTLRNRGLAVSESKFENAFFGNGAKFKADALNELLKLAA